MVLATNRKAWFFSLTAVIIMNSFSRRMLLSSSRQRGITTPLGRYFFLAIPTVVQAYLPQRRIPARYDVRLWSSDKDTVPSNLPRVYVDTSQLSPNHIVSLSPAQSNYLYVVRLSSRKRWGDWANHIRVWNGLHGEWLAQVLENSNTKKRKRRPEETPICCLTLIREQPPPVDVPVHLYASSLAKSTRRSWLLEKVTELGVDHIWWMNTELANSSSGDSEKQHLQVVEAAEQCERMTLPKIDAIEWHDVLQQVDDGTDTLWVFCRERSPSSTPLWKLLSTPRPSFSSVHILVGPEGGWSKQELEDVAARPHVLQVSLGSTVLRAETAAMVAVSTATAMLQQH